MSHTFTVKIAIGNDAMSTSNDVAEALHQVADIVRGDNFGADLSTEGRMLIWDRYGNQVGHYQVASKEMGEAEKERARICEAIGNTANHIKPSSKETTFELLMRLKSYFESGGHNAG